MKLTRAQSVRLGTFLISGTALFAVGLLTLTGLKLWERRETYSVRFSENVSGLEASAPVKYQGLRVGRVERLQIAVDDPSLIEVTLSLDRGTKLYEGTRAVLESSGITGLKMVNLTPGDPRKAPIAPGSRLPAGESFVDRLTGKAEEIAVKVELVANQLARWTRDENRIRVEELVDAATVVAGEIAGFLDTNRESFRTALIGVGEAGHAFSQIAGEGTNSLHVIEGEVTKTLQDTRLTLAAVRRPLEKVDPNEVAETVAASRRAMSSLDERLSSKEFGQALTDLHEALTRTTRLLEETDLAVRAGREDFVSSMHYLQQAAEDVREFSRIIAQDPSALIRGVE